MSSSHFHKDDGSWSSLVQRNHHRHSIHIHQRQKAAVALPAAALSNDHDMTVSQQQQQQQQQQDTANTIIDRSTLTLLEHINLNVPHHTYIVPFYFHLLGMGLDTRRASNMVAGKGTLWANCGSSQFHLPYGDTPQVIPGIIGLRYLTLEPLMQRLQFYDDDDPQRKPFLCYTLEDDSRAQAEGQDTPNILQRIKIVDLYGNTFLCRQITKTTTSNLYGCGNQPNLSLNDLQDKSIREQDVLKSFIKNKTNNNNKNNNNHHLPSSPSEATMSTESECKGIDFVEIFVPQGTADKIAEFYDCIFDANVSVLDIPHSSSLSSPTTNDTTTLKLAIVAFGNIDSSGRSSQSLVFREISDQDPDIHTKLKPYDGYHIALYVGSNTADFEQAFQNCQAAGIVWVNPRFSDAAMNLVGARTWKQFRFKDVLDLETGHVLIQLEHEVRSIEHEAWPGFLF